MSASGLPADDRMCTALATAVVALDERSSVFVSQFPGTMQVDVVRASEDRRGPGGGDCVFIEHRVATGHMVAAYQPANLMDEIISPRRNSRWLRNTIE